MAVIIEYTDDVSEVNPDTANVFATAAFHFGHSLVPDTMTFSDATLKHQHSVDLSKVWLYIITVFEIISNLSYINHFFLH